MIGVDLGLRRAGGLGVLRGMMTESSSSRDPNLLSLGDFNEISSNRFEIGATETGSGLGLVG